MQSVISHDWQPNDEVLQRLAQVNVDRDFALSLVLEFRIYWQERGYRHHSWSAKFLSHVMHEWRRHEVMLAQGRAFIPMSENWKPNANVLWALAEQKIPEAFALAVLPEFRIYWMDHGLVTNLWNSKFIGHVRYRWQNRQLVSTTNQPTSKHSLTNDLTNREWATEYLGGTNGNRKN